MPHQASTSTGTELGEFLRTRRAALDPRTTGLPDDGRLRRVPGLRREELAQLSHVSVDYIVRLEQGRTRRVSQPVLDALADALRLAADEREYLFALAQVVAPARTRPGRPEAAAQLRHLLDAMPDVPATILHRRMDVLAWNRAAAALLTDFGVLPPQHRNMIRLTFLDPAMRALTPDWRCAARECVAILRKEAGQHPADSGLATLVGELSMRDPDFRTWWASHLVRGARQLRRTYRHPVVGDLTLDIQHFTVESQPDQYLVAYTAPPGTPSAEALRFLLQWSAHPAREDPS